MQSCTVTHCDIQYHTVICSDTLCAYICAAAAQQEDEEDMDAAEAVGPEEMAVGTLLITHLTNQDLRSMEVLLPREAVEANIPSAITHPLIKFEVQLSSAILLLMLHHSTCHVERIQRHQSTALEVLDIATHSHPQQNSHLHMG